MMEDTTDSKEGILELINDTIKQIKIPPLHPTLDKEEIVSILTRCKNYIEDDEDDNEDLDIDDIVSRLEDIEGLVSSLRMDLDCI